jgi:hypothetical protein
MPANVPYTLNFCRSNGEIVTVSATYELDPEVGWLVEIDHAAVGDDEVVLTVDESESVTDTVTGAAQAAYEYRCDMRAERPL